ncbi:MAG: LacI family DNA-binding transcriptional regulator [Akkermansiaceae bacterium]
MPKINQQTIADRLGLSRATVSRCFTNHAGINPVTRAKVFQVAAELGYTHMEGRTAPKNNAARKQLGFTVLICSEADEYFHGDYTSPGEEILAGVSEYAQAHDIRIDINLISPKVTDIEDESFRKISSLRTRAGRGVLLIYPFPTSVIDQLALRFPIVSLVDQEEHIPIDSVDVDHSSGISVAIDRLVAAGHRRIGFYTRDYPIEATWSFHRYGAFLEKMARLKLRVNPEDVLGVFPSERLKVSESIDRAAERTKSGVTAWVCAADHQAYDLVSGFKKRDLVVPKDVSVTGFDGIQNTETGLALTTIKIPYREIGMSGAERLASRLRKRFAGKQRVYISGELKSGDTIGEIAH